jgi:2-phospho-L-lactate guanylyltransferase
MIGATDIWAVLPVKEFDEAKNRLSITCSPAFRRGLARAMTQDVLSALSAVSELAGIVVVTADPEAAELSRAYGAEIFLDGARDGHTGAVAATIGRFVREGRGGVLTVPGDIPLISATEVSRLIRAHGQAPAFSIVPANDLRGSNAILMTPPDAVPLAFGDDSFYPHLEAARARGITPSILRMPGIGLDIDNFDDLRELLKRRAIPTRTWDYLAAARCEEWMKESCG